MRKSRWLLPLAVMAVMASCKTTKNPPDSSQPPGGGLKTINPQGPYLTGWAGTAFHASAPTNGAFEASIQKLPKTADDTSFRYQYGGDTYELRYLQADPCPARYQGNEIPLPLYKVYRTSPGSDVTEDVCHGTTYQTLNPNVCEADPRKAVQYGGAAIAVPGKWDTSGNYSPCDEGTSCFTISCLSGVIGECAHWGYVPQYRGPDGKLDLAPYLQACVRAASGDYVGNGNTFTCQGTYIDVIDDLGIQQEDAPTIGGLEIEAGWTENGAYPVGTTSPANTSPAGTSPEEARCVRPRFIGCEQELAGQEKDWVAARDCRMPPSVVSREPPYLPKNAPYKLVTRAWPNHGTGDRCVWPDPSTCPSNAASQCFGPHPCNLP